MHMKKITMKKEMWAVRGAATVSAHSNFLRLRVRACVCVFVCARARARVCVVCARGVKTLMSRAAFKMCVRLIYKKEYR